MTGCAGWQTGTPRWTKCSASRTSDPAGAAPMAAFNYRALDSDGREVRGVLEAETSRVARGRLRDQQLSPIEVTPAGARTPARPPGGPAGVGGAPPRPAD